MVFKLPQLNYSYDELEPIIDAQTMEIHHGKHHQGYVDKLNAAIDSVESDTGDSSLQQMSLEQLLTGLETDVPESIRTAVRNNGGGHANHTMFWEILTPGGSNEPIGKLAADIPAKFGSFADFKQKFNDLTVGQFGSGWGWLVVGKQGLEIITTANQDSPLLFGHKPVLGVDVWEHAYYLKYKNERGSYLANIWEVINWDKVAEIYESIAS